MAEPQEATPCVRTFIDLLRELNEGSVHDQLSAELQALTEAVARHRKAGTLTLTIAIKPSTANAFAYFVAHDIKVKAPAPDKQSDLMFINDDNKLQRKHPKQNEIPGLRAVGDKAEAVRKVDAD